MEPTEKSAAAQASWTADQETALRRIPEFFRAPDKQLLTVAGPAGVGKSTILAAAFSGHDKSTAIAAPTAKACRVLHGLGLKQAQTIHSLVYTPVGSPTGKCQLCDYVFRDGDRAYAGEVRGEAAHLVCEKCRPKLTNAQDWRGKGPRFRRREFLDANIRRIVADEASMINASMARDILSFGLPTLVIGDGFQLPPPQGDPGFDLTAPDIALVTIHRQALDSPIIAAAEVVRLGGDLGRGVYGENNELKIAPRIDVEELACADQVIIGRNKTRVAFNRRIRKAIGFESDLPEPGDRIICIRNNHQKGLINGAQFMVTTAVVKREPNASSDTIVMELRPLDDPTAAAVKASTPVEFFTQTDASLPWYDRNELDEFAFANAITAHKSQGSEWPHVVVIDESACFRQHARRWLYTAIVRASSRLTLVM